MKSNVISNRNKEKIRRARFLLTDRSHSSTERDKYVNKLISYSHKCFEESKTGC